MSWIRKEDPIAFGVGEFCFLGKGKVENGATNELSVSIVHNKSLRGSLVWLHCLLLEYCPLTASPD